MFLKYTEVFGVWNYSDNYLETSLFWIDSCPYPVQTEENQTEADETNG